VRIPRFFRHCSSPEVTVVFPHPLPVPAITMRAGGRVSACPPGLSHPVLLSAPAGLSGLPVSLRLFSVSFTIFLRPAYFSALSADLSPGPAIRPLHPYPPYPHRHAELLSGPSVPDPDRRDLR